MRTVTERIMPTQEMILAGVTAFVITALLGPVMIPVLKKLKFGQSILEEGPSWHKSKQGVPTMGGLLFGVGIVVAFLIAGYGYYMHGDVTVLAALALALVFGAIGFCDDYISVKKKRNLGLTAMQKLILQVLATAAFLIFLYSHGAITTNILIPFTNIVLELGLAYYILALLLIVGMVNAVNFTDGLDGLLSSVTIPVMLFCLAAGLRSGAQPVAVLASAVIGGLAGFLIFNFHPAKIFMGDTGSLFLGGAVMGLLFCLNIPEIVVIAGIVYVAELLSVVLQVLVYKLTKKRIFKMAPIHHHFEMCGWSEVKVVCVFTLISLIACMIAYLATGSFYCK